MEKVEELAVFVTTTVLLLVRVTGLDRKGVPPMFAVKVKVDDGTVGDTGTVSTA